MKQTAVDFLLEKQNSQMGMLLNSDFIQAKEMEKQQIIEACEKFGNLNGVDIEDYEQYHNETFNK